jgi:hypothetical protein
MSNLYILKDEVTGFLKIGRARDVLVRIRNLRVGNPNLNLIKSYETIHCSKIEAFLHKRFAHFRQRGEFFQVTLDEVEKEINHALTVIQDRPDKTVLQMTQESLALDPPRDANHDEIKLLTDLLEVRAEMATLTLRETALEERLKVSIGNSSGLTDWATFKSLLREDIDATRLRVELPEIYEKYKKSKSVRQLKVRKFINFNNDLDEQF